MILEIARGHIKMKINEKTITIEGEGYLRGHGSPDFVVYSNSIRSWDPPFNLIEIDKSTKNEILEKLKEEMTKKNMTIEIE